MRLAELITLKEQNINLRDRTLKVLGKRNKERVIPFSIQLVSIIEAYLQTRNKEVEKKNHGKLLVTQTGDEVVSDVGKSHREKIHEVVYFC
jgi:integrase/recombinase XerC